MSSEERKLIEIVAGGVSLSVTSDFDPYLLPREVSDSVLSAFNVRTVMMPSPVISKTETEDGMQVIVTQPYPVFIIGKSYGVTASFDGYDSISVLFDAVEKASFASDGETERAFSFTVAGAPGSHCIEIFGDDSLILKYVFDIFPERLSYKKDFASLNLDVFTDTVERMLGGSLDADVFLKKVKDAVDPFLTDIRRALNTSGFKFKASRLDTSPKRVTSHRGIRVFERHCVGCGIVGVADVDRFRKMPYSAAAVKSALNGVRSDVLYVMRVFATVFPNVPTDGFEDILSDIDIILSDSAVRSAKGSGKLSSKDPLAISLNGLHKGLLPSDSFFHHDVRSVSEFYLEWTWRTTVRILSMLLGHDVSYYGTVFPYNVMHDGEVFAVVDRCGDEISLTFAGGCEYRFSPVYGVLNNADACDGYVIFPLSSDEKRDAADGMIPLLPGNTDAFTELLSSIVAKETETVADVCDFEKSDFALPAGIDLSDRRVIVGSYRNGRQLEWCVKNRKYYVPAAQIRREDLPLEYVALYDSKKSQKPGIRLCGKISSFDVVKRKMIPFKSSRGNENESYYYFDIEKWETLERPISFKGDFVYEACFTSYWQLMNSDVTYELFRVRSNYDYYVMKALFYYSERALNERKDTSVKLSDNCRLKFSYEGISLQNGDGEELRFYSRDTFDDSPEKVFGAVLTAVKKLSAER